MATIAAKETNPMHAVGVRELKDRLAHYLRLVKRGDRVIVTDRGKPVAVLHSLDRAEEITGIEERLAVLAREGMLRLPLESAPLNPFGAVRATGKPLSDILLEERG